MNTSQKIRVSVAHTDNRTAGVRQALRALRNKASIAAGTLTVTKEDDSTTSHLAYFFVPNGFQ